MADQWEEAPPLYLQLDIQSLFRGDDLNKHSIQEVDMDMDDAACDEGEAHKLQQREDHKIIEPNSLDAVDGGSEKIGERWNAEEDEEEVTGMKELGRSKWSKDVDEDTENADGAERSLSALSGLIQAYGKSEKSVHWGDRDSNPLPNEEDVVETAGRSNVSESKRRFSEQLRAERESFKAVFDRRRQRIGGLWDAEDE